MNDMPKGPRPVADPPSSDVAIEQLLRRAGRRAPIPIADTTAVREAARTEWQRTVRAERQRKLFLRTGGGLLAAAALLLLALNLDLWQGGSPPPLEIATLEATTGALWAVTDQGDTRLQSGANLTAGIVLETRQDAELSRAVLRLADGPTVRLDVDSRLRLVSTTVLELEHGAVYIDTGSDQDTRSGQVSHKLAVHTALGIARDIGTRFEVRLTASPEEPLLVRVRNGKVALEHNGDTHLVATGVELALASDGAVLERPIPLNGAPWDWTLAVLPVFEIEGRSLHNLLDWLAREGGWSLRFAEPALAEQASLEVLSGSPIADLSFEEAAAMALLGSGLELSYRLEDGAFIVESSAHPPR